jgi:5-(carboxyamino)imidazole ribonucleotide synthase
VSLVRPGGTIGILGGGQLGRMLALAARSMGYRVEVLDPDSSCAASPVADRVVAARFDDATAALSLAQTSDVVTIETERVAKEALAAAATHAPTRPGIHVLALSQDRRAEKQWLTDHGLPTAPYRVCTTADEVAAAVRDLGPSVAKTATEGYDGRGQARLRAVEDAEPAFRSLGGRPVVVEQWLDLALELSVIVARRPSGEIRTFPAALNHHEHQVLDWSVVPSPRAQPQAAEADALAKRLAAELGLEGILAIELFVLDDGRLVVNELAPRPHNSGHALTEACATSQFEQLVRAVCDLPLGPTEVIVPVAIANLLGDLWTGGDPPWERALEVPGVRLHLYGKQPRPGRKMGHLSALGATPDEAVARVLEARGRLEKRG